MPKYTLSFDLPEEAEAHLLAINGWAYREIILDLHKWLRGKDQSDNNAITTDDVRTALRDAMEERSLDL